MSYYPLFCRICRHELPSPEQTRAAMPAMRRYLVMHFSPLWELADEERVIAAIERKRFGGIERFVQDLEAIDAH